MRRFLQNMGVSLVVLLSVIGGTATLAPTPAHAAACSESGSFFGLPHWWRGLEQKTVTNSVTKQTSCSIIINGDNNFQDVWTIVLNVVDILLRLIGLAAVGFIIYGGGRYIISQGNASQLTAAKQTITHAIVGLIIAISAVFILNFIAGNILKLTVNKDTYQVTYLEGRNIG